jgi:4-carboxymuconolactone decarboxylase
MLNLAMLGGLGRSQEFVLRIRGALNNGCDKEEIREVLLQLAIYAYRPAWRRFASRMRYSA